VRSAQLASQARPSQLRGVCKLEFLCGNVAWPWRVTTTWAISICMRRRHPHFNRTFFFLSVCSHFNLLVSVFVCFLCFANSALDCHHHRSHCVEFITAEPCVNVTLSSPWHGLNDCSNIFLANQTYLDYTHYTSTLHTLYCTLISSDF